MAAKDIVLAYIKAMEERDYVSVKGYLGSNVTVKGPAGEAFRSQDEFIEMMKKQGGKYDLKKVFAEGDEVCLLYDYITPSATVFFASWYKVKDRKITFIQTVFDPRPFERKNQ